MSVLSATSLGIRECFFDDGRHRLEKVGHDIEELVCRVLDNVVLGASRRGRSRIRPVQVKNDLHGDDGVVFVLDPEQMKHELHQFGCMGPKRFNVRQAMQDLEKQIAKFLDMAMSRSLSRRPEVDTHILLSCTDERWLAIP